MSNIDVEKLVADGSDEAIARLYEFYRPLVATIAGKYVRSKSDVDDLVSEASIIMMNCVRAFDPSRNDAASFKTYFVQSIHRRFARYYRENEPIFGRDVDVPIEIGEYPAEDLFDYSHDDGTKSSQLAIEAAAFLGDMPETAREIVSSVLAGKPLREVADEMDLAYCDAKVHLRKALDSLMSHIKIYAPQLIDQIPADLRDLLGGGDKTLLTETLRTAQWQCIDQHSQHPDW